MIHTVKGFGRVTKAEIDVVLELSCFFDDPADVGNLISGSSAFSKMWHSDWWLLTVWPWTGKATNKSKSAPRAWACLTWNRVISRVMSRQCDCRIVPLYVESFQGLTANQRTPPKLLDKPERPFGAWPPCSFSAVSHPSCLRLLCIPQQLCPVCPDPHTGHFITLLVPTLCSLHFVGSPRCFLVSQSNKDFPGGSDGKRICLQCRRPRFDP